MAEGYSTGIGGLSGGLQQGVQNAVAITQAKQQKEAFDIEKRQALFGEAMKNLALVRDKSLPEEFRTKVWNFGVVPGFTKVFPQFEFPNYEKLPEGIDGGIKSLQTIFERVAKGEMTAAAAQHAIGAIELQTGQEAPAGIKDLLKTGAEHDFQLEKQKRDQEFEMKKEKFKSESGGEGGATFSKIEGRILEKYLSKQPLTAEEKTVIDNRLVDPLFSQVLTFYAQDPMNMGKKTDQRVKELESTIKTIRAMQAQGLNIASPAQSKQDPQVAQKIQQAVTGNVSKEKVRKDLEAQYQETKDERFNPAAYEDLLR